MDRRGRDRMVGGFPTNCAISDYLHQRCGFEPHSGNTTLYDKVCPRLAAGQWFSPGTPV